MKFRLFGVRNHRIAGYLGAAVTIASTTAGGVLGVATPAAAATPHANPVIKGIELSTSDSRVTTSTQKKLRVQLIADAVPGAATGNDLEIAVSDGPVEVGETHIWTFPDTSTALKLSPSGNGTLQVPAAKLAPFGAVSLKITPTGTPKTQSCQGTPGTKTQHVKVSGTFYFDTKSTGAGKWGTIGSRRTTFTFPVTNEVIWSYLPQGADRCGGTGGGDGPALPCTPSLLWDDEVGAVDLSGFVVGGVSVITADRTVQLTKPAASTREDTLFGTGPTPQLTTTPDTTDPTASDASLPVSGEGDATGSATMTSSSSASPLSVPCGNGASGQTITASLWQHSAYANGTTPLAVDAEVFGAISQPDNSDAEVISLTTATS
jgi:hypothetical protein